jgi:predicted acyltransferase
VATTTDLRTQAPVSTARRADRGSAQGRGRPRLRGVDVARGLAVVGMLFVDNRGNAEITSQLVHQQWNGLHVADVVFPVFLLIVGVSMPFSRRAQRPRAVLWRVVKLLLLGTLLVTAKLGWSGFAPGVLGHIAGGYLLCWLLLRLPARAQLPVAAGVLAALTVLYRFVPVPGAGHAALSPSVSWGRWLDTSLGLPSGAEGVHSYLPSAITVFLGVLAGRLLRDHRGPEAVRRLLAGGAGLVVAGLLLALVVPLNKQLWSPSYVLVTGGIGLAVLAAAFWLVDLRGVRRPFRFAEVLGIEAIVAFAFSELVFRALLSHSLQPVLVGLLADALGPVAAAYLYPTAGLLVIWGVCAGLLRKGIVVRI